MRRVNFASLLGSRAGPEVDLVMGMVAARIIAPQTKLATTRWWQDNTLAQDLGIAEASEDDLYLAVDWLVEGQEGSEAKLAARHLQAGGLVLYDLSSSYFEGTSCPLAARGHNRDGKKGKLQVNYGLLTDRRGCPIGVSVYKGNTGDGTTFLPQVRKLRDQFGLEHEVFVGDRGLSSNASVRALRNAQFSWLAT